MAILDRKISLDHPTAPGLTPLELISLAGALDCDAVSIRLHTHPSYPNASYNLVNDQAMRARIRAHVADCGLRLALGSGFEIHPATVVSEMQPAIDALADMGADALSVVVYDRDKSRHFDRVADLAERSGAVGVRSLIEYFALSGVDSLAYAIGLLNEIDSRWIGLGADSLHFTRTGTTASELAAVPSSLIGHAQINDGPLHMPLEMQLDEARGGRLLPGEGEFDLIGFVRALPADVTIGIEAGSKKRFESGVSMEEHARAAVAATHRLLTAALAHR
jgi:sugar phosphate isomerase/epimerase